MSAILTMQQQGWEAYAGKFGVDLMHKAQQRLAWICERTQGEHVLEVDCGQAAALILLARTGKTVVGLCNDLAIHKQARSFVGQEPSQVQRAITLHQGTLEDTHTLVDHSFDTIILTECLVRADMPSDLIEIAYRKLKPEGTLITLWPIGVQDDPRARHTFFVREPARLLSRHFETQQTQLLGDTIGFVSTARKKVLARTPAQTTWPDDLVKDLESALQRAEQNILSDLHAAQQQLRNVEVIHSDASERLATLDKLQAQHESHAATLRAQLDSLQDAKREAESAAQLRIAELQAELQARQVSVEQASHAVAQAQAQSRILELEQVQQIAVLRHEKLEREMRIQELERRVAEAASEAAQAKTARDEAVLTLQQNTSASAAEKAQLEQRVKEAEAIAEQALLDAQTALREATEKAEASQAAAQAQQAQLEGNLREQEARAAQALQDAELAHQQALQKLQLEIESAQAQQTQLEERIRQQEAQAALALQASQDAHEQTRLSLEALQLEHEAAKTQLKDTEARVQALDAALASTKDELAALRDSAAQAQRLAAQQLQSLQSEKSALESEKSALESERTALQTHKTSLENEKTALQRDNKSLEDEKAVLQRDKSSLENEKVALQREKTALQSVLQDSKAAHEQIAKQHQQAQLSLKSLDAQLQQTRNTNEQAQTRAAIQLRELQSQLVQAQSQFTSASAQLKESQLKYRDLLQRYRDGQELEKEQEEKLRHLERRVRKLQHEKEQALHQVDQTRRSQSFRVGYTLLHAFKSWSAFSRLPSDLLSIRRDVVAQRSSKQRKQQAQGMPVTGKIAPVIRAPQAPVMLVSTPAVQIGQQAAKTRIAAIMDEFTFHSYAPESELLQLRPETWQQEIEAFKPDLVFIESAWKGVEDLWARKVSNCTDEVRALLQWARDNNVPSMFWNKEDPVHFSTFIELASLVDHVFTTDVDCIPKYKKILGHNRVYLLPFAAQPAAHNPVEIYDRKDAFNFAGSYYLRYPERQRDFAALIDTVQQFKPVDIYDRNYEKPHPHYQFPEKYSKYILGTLKFDEIDRAYKGYRYGINMNTIKQSQTMFARRVFELLASNTVVVSNFSRGVRLMFGDLVISSDNAEQIDARVRAICNDELTYRKFRLAGLRKVMAEHTYRHRLDYIKAKLSNTRYSTQVPGVAFVAAAKTEDELRSLLVSFKRQSHPACRLFVLCDVQPIQGIQENDKVSCHGSIESLIASVQQGSQDIELIGLLHPEDYYGEHYAEDLAWASTYSPDAEAFGKVARYQHADGKLSLIEDGKQYRFTQAMKMRSAVIRATGVSDHDVNSWLADSNNAHTKTLKALALDEFNYAEDGASAGKDTLALVNDMTFALSGVSFATDLAPLAESMAPADVIATDSDDDLPSVSGVELAKLFATPASKLITLNADRTKLRVQSRLDGEKHAYLYLRKAFRRDEINMVLNSQFQLICDDPGDVRTVFEFQDKDGRKISHSMMGAAGTHALAIPNECVFIRFGLRLMGRSDIKIHKLVFGTHGEKPAVIAGRSSVLVLTKQYPAYDDLYKYGFLHTRVRAYQRLGHPVEVFRITNESTHPYREFENVDVAAGNSELLRDTLKTGRYKHVLVHILDTNMWNVLKDFLDTIKVTVWAHGSEIQLWPRRAYEFSDLTPDQITRKKKLSDNRKSFWRMVLSHPSKNLSVIFVSNWLKNTTEQDIGVSLSDEKFKVIPNFVDGSIFNYSPKSEEQRKCILSIRPYASKTYANDLTVQAILELANEPYFKQLTFELCGDGDLFDETTAPVAHFDNVTLTKRFLTHAEIAAKHKEYGILLCPTRMDTQGVSRDEAMASGLVPVTSDVAAVNEFLSNSEGYLCPAEDALALAEAVKHAVEHPGEFLIKSQAAGTRAHSELNIENTIHRELVLFTGRKVSVEEVKGLHTNA